MGYLSNYMCVIQDDVRLVPDQALQGGRGGPIELTATNHWATTGLAIIRDRGQHGQRRLRTVAQGYTGANVIVLFRI